MPYYKRKQDCKQKSGQSGTYVTIKKDDGERKCWKSEEAFKKAAAARHASEPTENDEKNLEKNKEKINEFFLRSFIRIFLLK